MANLPLEKVKELYYNKEYTAQEIGKFFSVSRDVVYDFMIKMRLPRRNLSEQNRVSFDRKPLSFKIKRNLTKEEEKLKIAGIMLYWAEGANGYWTVDLSNSDPKMILIFLKFLRIICGVNEQKLRGLLYCYGNQDVEHLKKFWSKITKIPLAQFIKPYIRRDFSLKKSGKMRYGLFHIRYTDKKLLKKIRFWIDKYKEEWAGTEVDKPS